MAADFLSIIGDMLRVSDTVVFAVCAVLCFVVVEDVFLLVRMLFSWLVGGDR